MNPYEDMPKSSFWRSGVVEDESFEDIHMPKWGISPSDCIVTMGSCFAQHVGKKLKTTGFKVPYFDTEDGIKSKAYSANYGNIYTIRQALQLLQESNGKFHRDEKYWKTDMGYIDPMRPNVFERPFPSEIALDKSRKKHLEAVRSAIMELDILVFTLGLTEAWERVSCKSILPIIPGVLGGTFSDETYKFRNFNYTEISSDLDKLIKEIHDIRKGQSFKLLLTVSPVPLTATAESRHVLSSTVASKSILRAVADEFARKYDFIDYFPSFEIVTNPKYVKNNYEENLRNVKQTSVDNVMEIFHSSYVNKKVSVSSKNTSIMIDEVGDIDCEEALLEQFKPTNNNLTKEKDILFFGNSHLGFLRNSLTSKLQQRSIFIPNNFLKNNPIENIQTTQFQEFYFNNPRFDDVESHQCNVLVIVGYGIAGDGILRSFGPIETGYEGCNGREISPHLSPTDFDPKLANKLFRRQLTPRINHLKKITESNLFDRIICIVAPDLPEKVARFRLGDEAVDSKIFKKYRSIYMEEMLSLIKSLDPSIHLICHDNDELYTDSGFVKDSYAGTKLWDIHPHSQFYVDSKIEERILEIMNPSV